MILTSRPPTQCAGCRDALASAPVSRCEECDTPQHVDCLAELGCCSMGCYGSTKSRALENPLHPSNLEGMYSAHYDDHRSRWSIPYWPSLYEETDPMADANRAVWEVEHGGECCRSVSADYYYQDHVTPCSCDRSDLREACSFYHGSGWLDVEDEPCGCREDEDDPWACERNAVELLNALEDYPCLDDSTESEFRYAYDQAAWDDFGRQEFESQLVTLLGDYEGTSDQLDDWAQEAWEGTGTYPGENGPGTFACDTWAEWVASNIDPETLADGGFYGPEYGPEERTRLLESNRAGLVRRGREYGEAGMTPRQARHALRSAVTSVYVWRNFHDPLHPYGVWIRREAREAFLGAYMMGLMSAALPSEEKGDAACRQGGAREVIERIRRGECLF